ncbi:hypothetical protein E4U55_008047 [Claviceps digitariae]|nr:hypothetical protein E4U55_008047 [Claviceps digitariae]
MMKFSTLGSVILSACALQAQAAAIDVRDADTTLDRRGDVFPPAWCCVWWHSANHGNAFFYVARGTGPTSPKYDGCPITVHRPDWRDCNGWTFDIPTDCANMPGGTAQTMTSDWCADTFGPP